MESLLISASEWGGGAGSEIEGVPLGDTKRAIMKGAVVLVVSAMYPKHGVSTVVPPPRPSQGYLEHCQDSQISGIYCVYTSV